MLLPLFLLAAGHLKDDVPAALAAARGASPRVRFDAARALEVVNPDDGLALARAAERVPPRGPEAARTALLVVGRGSSDPDANSDLCKLTRVLGERAGFARAEPCFIAVTSPLFEPAIEDLAKVHDGPILVQPYFLFEGLLVEQLAREVAAFRSRHPGAACRWRRISAPTRASSSSSRSGSRRCSASARGCPATPALAPPHERPRGRSPGHGRAPDRIHDGRVRRRRARRDAVSGARHAAARDRDRAPERPRRVVPGGARGGHRRGAPVRGREGRGRRPGRHARCLDRRRRGAAPGGVEIRGRPGVATVTRPGLGLEVRSGDQPGAAPEHLGHGPRGAGGERRRRRAGHRLGAARRGSRAGR